MAVCLVTGASGYIGSFVVKQLLSEHQQVIALVRDSSSQALLPKHHPGLTIESYDKNFECVFQKQPIDVVFHLAAHSCYDHSHQDIDALISANITFGAHLLELMSEFGCRNLVNTGSFSESSDSPEYSPQCFYAASKFCFQKIIDYYVCIQKINAITLRLTDTYGPNDPRNKLWPQLASRLASDVPLNLSKGEQLLDLVHVHDVSKAFSCAGQLVQNQSGFTHPIYYVASKKKRSLKVIIGIFEQVAAQKLSVSWGARPYREREIMNPFIGELVPGWQAEIELETGFRSLLQMDGILV